MTDVDLNGSEEARSTDVGGTYFAPGSSASKRFGVLYQGDFQTEFDGTATAIRLHSRALATTGVPVLLKYISGDVITKEGSIEPLHVQGLEESVKKEVGDLVEADISSLYPSIRHLVITRPEQVSNLLMRGAVGPLEDAERLMAARKVVYGGTVLYSVWERDHLDKGIARELRRVKENWVPCEQNAEMLRSSGVENVFVVPHPYDKSSLLCSLTRRKPLKTKRFYNIGRWEPRKNQALLIRCFLTAFRPEDDVHLTLKFHGSWADYGGYESVIKQILTEEGPWGKWTREQIDEKITTIEGFINPDKVLKLHYENNIYVGPSAGEAWCLPAFEAKVAGNVVIHTPYGGTADFCDERDIALPFSMGGVPESYKWGRGVQWAVPDGVSLVTALKETDIPQEYFRTEEFESRFSLEAVGKLMADRLMEHLQDGSEIKKYFEECRK